MNNIEKMVSIDSLVRSSEKLRNEILTIGMEIPWEIKQSEKWIDLEYAAEELVINARSRVSNFAYIYLPSDLDPTGKHATLESLSPKDLMELSKDLLTERSKVIDVLKHWDALQKFLDENDGAKNEWERFMMLMKLSGGDEK
jgi:hypothetical protein